MPATPPPGEEAPADGRLPSHALADVADRPFGVYVHVPFCATRCGYCDFNTYTPGELDGSASQQSWLVAVERELRLAARVLGRPPRAETVFVGGGTPSMLGAEGLAQVLRVVRETVGLSEVAEITTEANPESTDPEFFSGIRKAGFTRVSLGMQSSAEHVLRVLDRTHTPGRAAAAAVEARAAGIEHVSLDLIYGTPGESRQDLRRSVLDALAAGVDHVSAYSLIVEEGTAMARRVRRGELAAPDEDELAERYELVDQLLRQAGMGWYEVSNWARDRAAACHHNLLYWRGGNWWGAGPGAHSHVGGVRWWNQRHPARYNADLAADTSPAQAREVLTPQQQLTERVMLGLRLSEGLAASELPAGAAGEVERARDEGLLLPERLAEGRLVLTDAGRLLADGLALRLLS